MIEIRFHGRGGQGAVLASEMLAQAAFLEGKYPQSFPFFGVERRGAPVAAFCRIDDAPIAVRTSVTNPDVVVVLDGGLLGRVPVTAGLKPLGLLVVNTDLPPWSIDCPACHDIATVDATEIALRHGLGTRSVPIVNTAILGALVRARPLVSIESLLRAVEAFVPAKPSENAAAAREAYDLAEVVRGALA